MRSDEFEILVERIKGGSNDALSDLIEQYGESLSLVIRRRLHRLMRSQFDTDDFAQIVWASFFAGLERLSTFASAEAFERYLMQIAEHKVVDACRRRMILQKNNVNRECRLDASTRKMEIASGDPTASHVLSVREQWEQLLERLPEHYRQMISLRAAGDTCQEIADKLGVHERTVRRVLKGLAKEATQ